MLYIYYITIRVNWLNLFFIIEESKRSLNSQNININIQNYQILLRNILKFKNMYITWQNKLIKHSNYSNIIEQHSNIWKYEIVNLYN